MITIHKVFWIKKFTEILQSARITKIISQGQNGSVFFNLTTWTHTVKEQTMFVHLAAQHRVHFVGECDLNGKG